MTPAPPVASDASLTFLALGHGNHRAEERQHDSGGVREGMRRERKEEREGRRGGGGAVKRNGKRGRDAG